MSSTELSVPPVSLEEADLESERQPVQDGPPAFPDRGKLVLVEREEVLDLHCACSGDCDRPFRPKVITDSGDRDHAVTRPIGSA